MDMGKSFRDITVAGLCCIVMALNKFTVGRRFCCERYSPRDRYIVV